MTSNDPEASEPPLLCENRTLFEGLTLSGAEEESAALIKLGSQLKDRGYRFTTVTPASHSQVIGRPHNGKTSLRDVFGWSRAFSRTDLPEEIFTSMIKARVLVEDAGTFRSTVRFSTLGEQLFVHSGFPTKEGNAVFFGPDTYRFIRFIDHALSNFDSSNNQLNVLDLGCGSGVGGLHIAQLKSLGRASVVLSDINARAVFFSKINTVLNSIEAEVSVVQSDLFQNLSGSFDLIISNPPYLVDAFERQYRHGGGEFGSQLSLRIVEASLPRLAPGGRLLLYTGSAIVEGADLFYDAVCACSAERRMKVCYEEIDPDVFGEELEHPPYDRADRIAAVGVTIEKPYWRSSWAKQ